MPTTRNLDAALRELADLLRADIPETVERGLARMRQELPEFFLRDEDPDFVEIYRQSYRDQLRFIRDGLARQQDLESSEVPALAVAEARMAANFGIKLGSLLLGYRISHRLFLDEAIQRAEDGIADQHVRGAVLRAASEWMFSYFDWVTLRITEVYEQERDLLVRDRERRKRKLVRDLLEGRSADAGELRYALGRDHLGLVAWGDDPERALVAIGEAAGLHALTAASTDTTAWGWLGASAIDDDELRGGSALAPPAGVRLAVGDTGHGVEGFRRTHRQAWDAYRIARTTTEPITWHADIALLALTLRDPAAAREFVLRELGPLAERDERSELLRETLSAYFASGQNATAAAAALGVHDRTARYRIRTIEQRLGRSILARRDELGVALRLARVVLRDDDTRS